MNCKIVGYEYKTLEVVLSPGESFYAERGSIVYVDEALQREAEWNGSGAGSGLGNLIGGVLRSALSGESVLIIHFYNPTNTDRKMVLSGQYVFTRSDTFARREYDLPPWTLCGIYKQGKA